MLVVQFIYKTKKCPQDNRIHNWISDNFDERIVFNIDEIFYNIMAFVDDIVLLAP